MAKAKAAKKKKSLSGSADLQIVYREIGSLVPDPKNSNTHPAEQIAQLRHSIREYGFNKPILLKDDGKTIGAGNGAWQAAKEEGLTKVPTVTIRGLSAEKWRAFAIADNRVARNAEWNIEVLRAELNELQGFGFDLGTMGFSVGELGGFGVTGFGPERMEAAEETPEPPKVPLVQSGEMWLLGEHRLLVADCTVKENVERLLAGSKPHLMVTDPPYGVEYDPDWRNRADRANGKPYGASAIGRVSNDDRADWSAAYELFEGDVGYVWHPAGATQLVFGESLQHAGFNIRMVVIWAKQQFPIGRGNYHVQHEPCYYVVSKRAGTTAHWQGSRQETTLWQIDKPGKSETGHSTQKPIECMRRPILNNSKRGDAVYDPFLGSGTTLVAAEMEGRKCYGLEIDPAYGQVIIERWQTFTGKQAKREDGETLEDLKDGKIAKQRLKDLNGIVRIRG